MKKIKILSLFVFIVGCTDELEQMQEPDTSLYDQSGISFSIEGPTDPKARINVSHNYYLNLPRTSQDWCKAGDFDGDGYADLCTLNGRNAYMLFTNGVGRQVSYGTWSTNGSYGGGQYTMVGDYNGDGKDDIASPDGSYVKMKLSTGLNFVDANWYSQSAWGAAGYTVTGDFNGDGKDDIVTLTSSTKAFVRLSNGSGFSTRKYWSFPSTSFGNGAFTFAGDYDGDGKDDILSCSGNGVIVLKSNGGSFTKKTFGIDKNNDGVGDGGIVWGSTSHVWAADTDGDGRDEVLTASGSRIYKREFQSGNVFKETRHYYSYSSNWGWNYAVDITGDSTDEIISFSGNRIYVH